MHIEFLIEDSSSAALIQQLLPKLIGNYGNPHTWRTHSYKGIGRLPKGLHNGNDPSKRALLNQLPKLLLGYSKTSGIDAVVIILDTDSRNCDVFLSELETAKPHAPNTLKTLFGLATEEIEAWYFGDKSAVLSAFPNAKKSPLYQYVQDSVCDTWEALSDAIYPGGRQAVMKIGWPKPGQLKHEWANKIGPFMDVDNNQSASFCKFRNELRQLAQVN